MPKEAHRLLVEGKITKKEYWKLWLKENGYSSDIEYRDAKLKKKDIKTIQIK